MIVWCSSTVAGQVLAPFQAMFANNIAFATDPNLPSSSVHFVHSRRARTLWDWVGADRGAS